MLLLASPTLTSWTLQAKLMRFIHDEAWRYSPRSLCVASRKKITGIKTDIVSSFTPKIEATNASGVTIVEVEVPVFVVDEPAIAVPVIYRYWYTWRSYCRCWECSTCHCFPGKCKEQKEVIASMFCLSEGLGLRLKKLSHLQFRQLLLFACLVFLHQAVFEWEVTPLTRESSVNEGYVATASSSK